MADMNGADTAVIHQVGDYTQAALFVKVLQDEGIQAAVIDNSPSAVFGTVTLGDGVDDHVRAQYSIITPQPDAERAKWILRDYQSATPQTE